MTERIDLGGAQLSEDVIAVVADVLRSGWPGPGPLVEKFEQAFADSIGAQHVVAVSSGTAALHIAVRLLNLAPGSEIITTPITFIATNQVMLYEGLVPVFADVEPQTGNISAAAIAQRITDRTGAIMVMHYGGYPCDLDAVYAMAAQHTLPVIEDCAHAAGASYQERPIGSHDSLQAFSFQATKNLSAVDGGLLAVRNNEEAQRARRLRWMGIDSSTLERTTGSNNSNRYSVAEVGYRYAMSDINAAIALVQLKRLAQGNARRRAIANRYTAAFSPLTHIETLQHQSNRQSSHHLYALLCKHRDELAAQLRQRGIVTGNHYQRNDQYCMFNAAELPCAESFSNRVLTLPIHLGLKDADVDRVIESVIDCSAYCNASQSE